MKTLITLVGALAFLDLQTNVEARPSYRDRIPNGYNVRYDGNGDSVAGVGHYRPQGGGARNPFGQDFHNTMTWTVELCATDSDGDGRTNGEELGDPDCTWSIGKTPAYSTCITHPGIPDYPKCTVPTPPTPSPPVTPPVASPVEITVAPEEEEEEEEEVMTKKKGGKKNKKGRGKGKKGKKVKKAAAFVKKDMMEFFADLQATDPTLYEDVVSAYTDWRN